MKTEPAAAVLPEAAETAGPAAPADALILAAVQSLVGAAVVLDRAGAVAVVTPRAAQLLGREPGRGEPMDAALTRLGADAGSVGRLRAAMAATRAHVELFAPTSRRCAGLRARLEPIGGEGGGTAPAGFVLLLERAAGDSPVDGPGPVCFHGLWTESPAVKQVFHVVERVAKSDVSVLVRGETGTGKELIARALHALSPRADGPLHALNCAALPENLLESELFGHVRGSFTGAIETRPGHFRLAHGGTLFLDEVAEMPLTVQAKLLRVLETRSVIPVGGREPIRVDVRLIAATHRALRREVEAGRFRADLMYRLRVVPIFLPPLRERPGDVLLLTDRFCAELNRQSRGRQILHVSDAVAERFRRYDWPGNVRELRNVLEYAYAVGEGEVLLTSDLPPELVDAGPRPPAATAAGPHCDEASEIRDALAQARGSAQGAAEILGISRITLWRRMKALGLSRRRAAT